jgi:predicted Zn-dependent protease
VRSKTSKFRQTKSKDFSAHAELLLAFRTNVVGRIGAHSINNNNMGRDTMHMDQVDNVTDATSLSNLYRIYRKKPSDAARKALYASAVQIDLLAKESGLRKLHTFFLQLYFYVGIRLQRRNLYFFTEKIWLQRPHHRFFLHSFIEIAKQSGRAKRALQALEALTTTHTDEVHLFEELAHCAALCNETQVAFTAWEQVVRLQPENKEADSALKKAAEKLALGQERAPSIEQQLVQDPDNITLRMQWIDQRVNVREYSTAIAVTQTYLSEQTHPDPRLEKRLYLLKEHHINFQLAQAQDARDKSLIDKLQTELEALHIERLENYVQRDQNNLQYRYDLGKALLNGRKWKEAIAQLEFASHQRNRRIRSLIYLSEAYLALAEPEKARFHLETALAEAENNSREHREIFNRLETLPLS